MSRFMKLDIIEVSGEHYTESGNQTDYFLAHRPTRWINIYHVDEFIPTVDKYKYYDEVAKEEKSENRDATFLLTHHTAPTGINNTRLNRNTWVKVWGEAKDWVEKFEDAIDADMAAHHPEPEEDDSLKVNDRGVWLPGEVYMPLDLVQHPDDVSIQYMCTQESKSTDKETLTNTKFWCKVTF